MNRRGFLQSLGIGVAAVYLRLAPTTPRPLSGFTIADFEADLERIFAAPYRGDNNYIIAGPETAKAINELYRRSREDHTKT